MKKLNKLARYLKKIRRVPRTEDFVIILSVVLILSVIATHLRQMNSIMAIAVALLFGLVMGELAHKVKVPKVTGYMLAGLIIGPSVTGFMTHEILGYVKVISEITLGLIILSIGAEFEIKHFVSLGSKVILITIAEVIVAFILVTGVMYFFTHSVYISLLLGAISTATAPAATLMVVREYRSKGRLTEILLAVVAINNVLCLLLFHIAFSLAKMADAAKTQVLDFNQRMQFLVEPCWILIGSIVFGILIGYAINLWEQGAKDKNVQLLIVLGGVLFSVGAAKSFNLSPLLTTMAVGATLVNISAKGRRVLDVLKHTDPPFYVAFFVISGAMLHIDLLQQIGIIGLFYILARVIGKLVGSYVSTRILSESKNVQKYLGISLIPQAGVAIGVSMAVEARLPEIGAIIITVVLSSVIIYEMVGPYMTKMALFWSGEIPKKMLKHKHTSSFDFKKQPSK